MPYGTLWRHSQSTTICTWNTSGLCGASTPVTHNGRSSPSTAIPPRYVTDTPPELPIDTPILPASCVVGHVSWDIHTDIQRAVRQDPTPARSPRGDDQSASERGNGW
ncbi:hypothetical protein DPEC_G00340940 [Dallia pectoralis]|uniref:Uncharacterized protein n=1 Tax=Dallia pectoralis TaxID=75939 RepID=A0ACC2F5C1_DALPE|nr:hypothetical protein DPEC_G00340940 [Dallia pectoralis]